MRQEAGLSQPELFRRTPSLSWETVRAVEREPGDAGTTRGRARYPSKETLKALADGLGVSPDEFPEYRLAVARQALDERESTLEEAMSRLLAIETQLLDSGTFERIEITAKGRALLGSFRKSTDADPVTDVDVVVKLNGAPADPETINAAVRLLQRIEAITPQSDHQLLEGARAAGRRTADLAVELLEEDDQHHDETPPQESTPPGDPGTPAKAGRRRRG
jgi:transcriptional regulator with XRE-family HTH domain